VIHIDQKRRQRESGGKEGEKGVEGVEGVAEKGTCSIYQKLLCIKAIEWYATIT